MGTLFVGQKLGRYEILGELGQGGMSVVYRGHDTQLKRQVAIKVMHHFLADQPDAKERFHREAIAVAHLHHPHIIEIYDYSDKDSDITYMVAELVDGQSLAEQINDTALDPPEAALLLLRPLADALRHAHAAGVIHRDLKPENILVDAQGTFKLTDFGIARILDHHTLTVTGTLLGSPAYMSPEYIDGQEPDAQSDIFAFGVVAYQLVTGQLPFHGPSSHAVLKNIASGTYTPANQLNPNIDAKTNQLIDRCLAKNPCNRFPNASALTAVIDEQLDDIGLDANTNRIALLGHMRRHCHHLSKQLIPTYMNIGATHLKCGRRADAIDAFDRVLGLDPGNKQVRDTLHHVHRSIWIRRSAQLGMGALLGALLVTFAVGSWINQPSFAPTFFQTPSGQDRHEKDTRRQARVILRGVGTLYVDGVIYEDSELIAQDVSGEIPLLLKPGPHHIRALGDHQSDQIEFVVPVTGRTPDIELNVATDPSTEHRRLKKIQQRTIAFTTASPIRLYANDETTPRKVKQGSIVTETPSQGTFSVALPMGTHRLRFVSEFYQNEELVLSVSNQSPVGRIKVPLKKLRDGILQLTGSPPLPVNIYIDGQFKQLISANNADGAILIPLKREQLVREIQITKDGQEILRNRIKFIPGKRIELAL